MSRSQAWKDAERQFAKYVGGKRVSRGADFSKEDVDVIVPDFPEMRCDAKYRVRHAHHSFLEEIQEKYCADPTHEPVLFTKSHRQQGGCVTVRAEYFGQLVEEARQFRQQKSQRQTQQDNGRES